MPTSPPMPTATIEERVKQAIAKLFYVKVEELTPGTRFIEDLGIDSLDQVQAVMALEDEFGMEIPDDEAAGILTVGYAYKYVFGRVIMDQVRLAIADPSRKGEAVDGLVRVGRASGLAKVLDVLQGSQDEDSVEMRRCLLRAVSEAFL